MAISITHTTQVSTGTYPDDASKPVGTNEWNEAHTMTCATGIVVGRSSAGTGAVEELTLSSLSLFKRTIYTVNGTHTRDANAKYAFLQVLASGGAGGSADGAASSSGCGGGGGAGSYAEKIIDWSTITGTLTVTVGIAGAAGAAGNTAGGNGNTSSVAATGMTTVSCPGGNGGASIVAGTTFAVVAGGAETSAPTGGDLNVPGAAGDNGWRQSGTIAIPGQGAPTRFGGGGRGATGTTTTAGSAAGVYGAGGGGAMAIGNTDAAGGAGKAGLVIVEEYF
jgi:hypothetical protein